MSIYHYIYICVFIYVYIFIYIQGVLIPNSNIVLLSRSIAEKCEYQECAGLSGMDVIAWPMIHLVFCPFHELTCYSNIYLFHELLLYKKRPLSGFFMQEIPM